MWRHVTHVMRCLLSILFTTYLQHRGSSIPLGDQEKECRHASEFQVAYKHHPGVKGYDPSAVKTMQKTQFRLDDGHNFYNDYATTMKSSYIPKESDGKPDDADK